MFEKQFYLLLNLYRQSGQNSAEDLKNKDFKKELEENELLSQLEKTGKRNSRLIIDSQQALNNSNNIKKPRIDYHSNNVSQLDADDKLDDDDDDNVYSDHDHSDSDYSEDDTQALLAELNRIKRERAAEEAKREEEIRVQENKIRMENILSGNPLLNPSKSNDFKVKRRWDDDVVFKNCAKDDKGKDRSFINDTLRSEFHKKFMDKYIK